MKKTFFERVYQVTKSIPKGKVATYGQIAKKIQKSKFKNQNGKEFKVDARMVGWALHANNNPDVPCHRVVNGKGRLAPNFGFGGSVEQRRRLLREGIKFGDKKHVDLEEHKF